MKMQSLYPYQEAAVRAIGTAPAPTLNAFDPGLGKTRVAIETVKRRGYRRVLVFCPHSVVLVWESEVVKWWPGHPPVTIVRGPVPGGNGVFLASYGAVSEKSGKVAQHLADTRPFQATIIDESHYLKNPTSNRSRRIFDLLRSDMLGWPHPMSATPAPNHAAELWPLLFHLRPDLILSPVNNEPMLEHEFKSRYCVVEHFQVGQRMVERITGSRNLPELRARIAPMLLMARKKDVLPQLPPLDFTVLPVDILPRHSASRGNAPHRGSAQHSAAQHIATQRFDQLDDDALLAQLRAGVAKSEIQQLGLAKVPAVVEWVSDFLDSDPGRKLVLWCRHHEVIDAYERLLAQYAPVKFDGRDNLDARRSAIQRFMSGKAKIFVGQILAGGVGLTLVSKGSPCSDVVFAESSFSPADNFQASCRVHRIGQQDGVLVRMACAAGTLDDRIQQILVRKSKDLAELFG
jgi:SNF2 family DNA or RNA helicase